MHCYNNQRYCRTGTPASAPSRPMHNMVQQDSSCRGQLAMGGVNWQRPGSPTYDLQTAFAVGTIYKDLNKPFTGKGGCR